MKHSLVLIAGAAALAACDKGPDINVKNASVGEVAEKVRAAAGDTSLIEPGKWETKVTLLDIDMPGMPPQMAQQMKRTMAKFQEHGYTSCLTEADVKRPKEDFFAGRNNNCRYDHFTMSGGKIDAALHCEGKSNMTMVINGTYSSEAYDATMAMDVVGGPEGKGMKMRSRSQSHRIGQCTAEEINAKNARAGK
ncbi:MAG TPA: DUF3617 domain-containing protein [Sphingomicrobium sp.]